MYEVLQLRCALCFLWFFSRDVLPFQSYWSLSCDHGLDFWRWVNVRTTNKPTPVRSQLKYRIPVWYSQPTDTQNTNTVLLAMTPKIPVETSVKHISQEESCDYSVPHISELSHRGALRTYLWFYSVSHVSKLWHRGVRKKTRIKLLNSISTQVSEVSHISEL